MRFSRKKIFPPLLLVMLIGAALAAVVGPRVWHFLKYGPGPHSLRSDLLSVDQGFRFPPGFVPDPGEMGKETIEGIDSDNDGVRDDIQRWIYALYPDEPVKRLSLRQTARAYQFSLREEFELETRRIGSKMIDRSIQCELLAFQDLFQSDYVDRHLKAKTLNTYVRTARYMTNQMKITAQEMSGEQAEEREPCESL